MIGDPVIVGAPSAIGLASTRAGKVRGVDEAPATLRRQGLARRLDAKDIGDVLPPARYADLVKPGGRVRNEGDVRAYSEALAERIAAASEQRNFIVLLGGDCSILLGSLLGLRRAVSGPVGLVYIDAHADFATLSESPSGSACSMALALAVGRAGTSLARLAGISPLVDPKLVAHIGARDRSGPYGHAALAVSDVLALTADVMQRLSPASVADMALRRVTAGAAGFWIHLDVDVIDPPLMLAVDSPLPGGLTFEQVDQLLRPLVRHPAALGLQLTIYDPTLDDGAGADPLSDLLVSTLAES